MARFSGDQPYLELAKETSWGSAPTWASVSPLHRIIGRDDDYYAPVWALDKQDLNTNVGHGRLWKRVTGIQRLTANLRTWAFPSSILQIVDWATKFTSSELDSYSIRFHDVNEYLQHVGLKVQNLTITGGADIAQQALMLDLQLVGKEETEISSWTEGAVVEDDPYVYQDGTITVDSGADATVRNLSISVANTLDVGVGTGTTVQWIDFARREITGTLTLAYADPALNDKFKAATFIDLSAVFTHAVASSDLTLNLQDAVDITSFTPRRTLNNTVLAELAFKAYLTSALGNDFSVSLS